MCSGNGARLSPLNSRDRRCVAFDAGAAVEPPVAKFVGVQMAVAAGAKIITSRLSLFSYPGAYARCDISATAARNLEYKAYRPHNEDRPYRFFSLIVKQQRARRRGWRESFHGRKAMIPLGRVSG